MGEEEIRKIVQEELKRAKETPKKRIAFREVMGEVEEEMERVGITHPSDRYALRNAFSTIVRAAFGVSASSNIPYDSKDDIVAFVNMAMRYIAEHRKVIQST